MVINGAYGRDYKNKQAILKDWIADKDFTIQDMFASGTYINKQDAECSGENSFNVRYNQNRKVAILSVSEEGWIIA